EPRCPVEQAQADHVAVEAELALDVLDEDEGPADFRHAAERLDRRHPEPPSVCLLAAGRTLPAEHAPCPTARASELAAEDREAVVVDGEAEPDSAPEGRGGRTRGIRVRRRLGIDLDGGEPSLRQVVADRLDEGLRSTLIACRRGR